MGNQLIKKRNVDLAPDLTPGQVSRLRKACREADKAEREVLIRTRNSTEAFIVWRRIAERGLPKRVRPVEKETHSGQSED